MWVTLFSIKQFAGCGNPYQIVILSAAKILGSLFSRNAEMLRCAQHDMAGRLFSNSSEKIPRLNAQLHLAQKFRRNAAVDEPMVCGKPHLAQRPDFHAVVDDDRLLL